MAADHQPTSVDLEALADYIQKWRGGKKKATWWWSLAHHSSLYLSSALGLIAAAVLKLNQLPGMLSVGQREDLATVLTVLASIITSIAASGGFMRKWRANRMTRSGLDQLRLDLMDRDADLEKVLAGLKKIKANHDREIVGAPIEA